MNVIEIYLPKFDSVRIPFNEESYLWVRTELIQNFGGLTQYDQPALAGFWKENPTQPIEQDELIIYEVMADTLSKQYWDALRKKLESLFKQKQILIKAHQIEIL